MNKVASVVLLLGLAACAQVRGHQGFLTDEVLVSSVQPGVDNRDSVAKTLGRPSFQGQFDANDWYYVARDTRQYAYARPHPTAQTVLRVHFDAAGNVASVQRTGVEKIASINPVNDKTPTLGRDRSFFEDLFGNIGTVGSTGSGAPTTDNPGG